MAGIRSRIALLGAALLGFTGLGKLLARGDRAVSTVHDEKPIASAPPAALTTSVKRWAPIGGGSRERARRRSQIERGILKCSPV